MRDMKYWYVSICVLLIFSIFYFNFHSNQLLVGPHGGEVKRVENYGIEVKNSFPNMYAFLLTENLTPISNKGVFCEIRFFNADGVPVDVSLRPYEKDGFVLESTNIVYNSYRVMFHLLGKSISVRFDNGNPIVKKR